MRAQRQYENTSTQMNNKLRYTQNKSRQVMLCTPFHMHIEYMVNGGH